MAERKGKAVQPEDLVSRYSVLSMFWVYGVLILIGKIRDFLAAITGRSKYNVIKNPNDKRKLAPLSKSFENFFIRRLFDRVNDVLNRPILGAARANGTVVMGRKKDGLDYALDRTKDRKCINLSSYNYLGFADEWEETCGPHVRKTLSEMPTALCTSRVDFGTTALHQELEELVAKFVGKEEAIVFNMGFGTNSAAIPALVDEDTLIVSDSMNHKSIVAGCRSSPAKRNICSVAHNDYEALDKVLKAKIIEGRPVKDGEPWKSWGRIIVIIEGIYSMEGEICDLVEISTVCKKYGAYLYVDEAHSIGALGDSGRGVADYWGLRDMKLVGDQVPDINIMMGTFTKSFGAMGGYIAGDKDLIAAIRAKTSGMRIASAMSPVVVQQIITSIHIISGEDGTTVGATKLKALKDNANYFRQGLIDMGCDVIGSPDSPVVPMMLCHPSRCIAFSRECLKRNLAVVSVGYPATPLMYARCRFCISAGHSRESMDKALEIVREVMDLVGLL